MRTTGSNCLPIGQIAPYQGNARTHSKEQVGQIAESIKRFGFNNPVLIDENGVIVAGSRPGRCSQALVPEYLCPHERPSSRTAWLLKAVLVRNFPTQSCGGTVMQRQPVSIS